MKGGRKKDSLSCFHIFNQDFSLPYMPYISRIFNLLYIKLAFFSMFEGKRLHILFICVFVCI